MKYLSLYKTSSEHSADNSRLIPNISLITDEQRLILTNENNIDTTFTEVDIIESFDDIINRFPTDTSSWFPFMPGLKIYGDNTDQSKAKNIKIYNDAQEYRNNLILNLGWSDTGQGIEMNVDALIIDNIIMDKYDGNYKYYIIIYNDSIILYLIHDILFIYRDGSVTFNNYYNIFPSPLETAIPYLYICGDTSEAQSKANNIELYNNAIQWRKDYISYKGLSDTGQPIRMFVDKLNIGVANMDEYDRYYHYHIDIYNNYIILLNERDSSELLTINGDGSVTILDIFNKFPSVSGTSTNMPGLKIYLDNTDQSKSENIKLYNDAIQWRKDYISNNGLSVNIAILPIRIYIDALIIDDIIWDEYNCIYTTDYDAYNYYIDIYNDHISLLENAYGYPKLLTISSDGSVGDINLTPTLSSTTPAPDYTPTPAPDYTPTPTPDSDTTTMTPDSDTTTTTTTNPFPDPTSHSTEMPILQIYTDNSDQSKAENIKMYNGAQQWYNDYSQIWHGNNTTAPNHIYVNRLVINNKILGEIDQYYNYYISIYTDRIILIIKNGSEVLSISNDGSVQFSFNKFLSPTNTATIMPNLKIYTDNTDQSKSNNIELYNNAIQWRNNYILHNELNDTGQPISMIVDALMMDDITIDKYDEYYQHQIDIYNDHIILRANYGSYYKGEVLTIFSDGSVIIFDALQSPTNISTYIPGINIYTDNSDQSKAENIKLYNNAIQWRNNYILHNGWIDNGQNIMVLFDLLVIDNKIIDKYDGKYQYHIDIYKDYIILMKGSLEILTISSDGFVKDVINRFPTGVSTEIPILKIYTDNTDQSKANNIELYNNAIQWRKDYISYNGWSDTGQLFGLGILGLIIDDKIIDKYDRYYNYHIYIYNNHITLRTSTHIVGDLGSIVLTIFSDGSVEDYITPTPTPTPTTTTVPAG